MSATINPLPARLMRGIANASLREQCEVWRNDGYGWKKKGYIRCTVHHRLTPPVPGDPADSTDAALEAVEIHLARSIPVRIGDHIKQGDVQWTVGGGNFSETYASFTRAISGRPISGSPRQFITLRRHVNGAWQLLPPQLVHIAWNPAQPDRLGGVTIRQFGWLFAPEGHDDLDVQSGDTFFYNDANATVQWVPPDPTDRREATFWVALGEST